MGKIIDITGQQFGTLIVIERHDKKDSWGKILWKCRCDHCGNTVIKTKSDIAYKMKSCGCLRNSSISAKNWNGYEEISKTYWSSVMAGAKSRKIDFDVKIELAWSLFVQQKRKCALTGLDINFSRNRKKNRKTHQKQTASLDRIDSALGYVEGNLQWVHKTVNIAKNNLSTDEFVRLCELVVHQRNY